MIIISTHNLNQLNVLPNITIDTTIIYCVVDSHTFSGLTTAVANRSPRRQELQKLVIFRPSWMSRSLIHV